MLKKGGFGPKKKLSLQLTSLLDMFTIILVFLMVSFQAEDKGFTLNDQLTLPKSSAKSPFKTAVNIAITNDKVLVEGANVYQLKPGGVLPAEDLKAPKLDPIVDAVKLSWDKANRDGDEENVVVIQADEQLPYRTIHAVMRSAAHAGFFRFRMVVEKE